MKHVATRAGTIALLAFGLSGCGWYRTDLPVRTTPQTEPHVTYTTSGATPRRMTAATPDAATPARAICGAPSAAAAEQAAIASGRFHPPATTNPDANGAHSTLFNDGAGTAVMITTAPDGYQCTWSDNSGTSTWQGGAPAT